MASCPTCGAEVLHVRDDFTDATFPVDVHPIRVRGFELKAPTGAERAKRAVLVDVEVHRPHSATCTARQALGASTLEKVKKGVSGP
jgi:hypothetical protein